MGETKEELEERALRADFLQIKILKEAGTGDEKTVKKLGKQLKKIKAKNQDIELDDASKFPELFSSFWGP